MIITARLINLKKPTLIFSKNKKFKINKKYYFEFCDFDYKLYNPHPDNPKIIKRKLGGFGGNIGFDLGTKLKKFLKLEYKKDYQIKIQI